MLQAYNLRSTRKKYHNEHYSFQTFYLLATLWLHAANRDTVQITLIDGETKTLFVGIWARRQSPVEQLGNAYLITIAKLPHFSLSAMCNDTIYSDPTSTADNQYVPNWYYKDKGFLDD